MSLKAAFSFLAATALLTGNVPALEVTGLRCEYLGAPCGMDVAQPRLSWQIRSGAAAKGRPLTRSLPLRAKKGFGTTGVICGTPGESLRTSQSR